VIERQARTLAALAAVGGSALLLAGGASPAARATPGDYVGTLQGTDAFVAVLVGTHGGVLAYVCDSKRIAEWFKGRAGSGTSGLTLRSKGGYRLQVTVAGGRATGTVSFPAGGSHPFSVVSVKRPFGLYRVEIRDGGKHYLGGWIVLGDGRTRGAAKSGTKIVGTSTLDFINPLPTL